MQEIDWNSGGVSTQDHKAKWEKYNQDLEKLLDESRKEWNARVEPLYTGLAQAKPNDVVQLEASALSMRQNITDELAYFSNQLSERMEKAKAVRRDKIMEYVRPDTRDRDVMAILNSKHVDKKVIMAAEVSFLERAIELFKHHLEFLIETRSTLQSYSFAVRNKLQAIEIMYVK